MRHGFLRLILAFEWESELAQSLRTIIIHRIITSRLSYHMFQTRNIMRGEVDGFTQS